MKQLFVDSVKGNKEDSEKGNQWLILQDNNHFINQYTLINLVGDSKNKLAEENQRLLANESLLKDEIKRLQTDLAEMKRIVEDRESLLIAADAVHKEDMDKIQMGMSIYQDLYNEVLVLKKNAERSSRNSVMKMQT
ncbi:hypothetical protein DICPUDRAFT_81274 [Dictyostelium purpureum]|uniref:Uncharacterized protein n=1 Tax=Dictyostelium purpureum TaxID=5786 RepID=F0ZT00_DICPU|nr:uncharacterized protein DICPUDRAFT_81274 [Dictyostelium purpureum]EGC32930.1 hypothetical protein DICPUDRAFT_81274 [Dictyostelium purpureum]|eukprot:XP_003290538.1 hypothetical protein DICPUDRAFT_81274 [Dictyostelium purpureum]